MLFSGVICLLFYSLLLRPNLSCLFKGNLHATFVIIHIIWYILAQCVKLCILGSTFLSPVNQILAFNILYP